MLLGIKYSSVFPKEVHTLPCGLTIYKSRLASHGGKYNACIGGPHSSFTGMTGAAGGTITMTGSSNWRWWYLAFATRKMDYLSCIYVR